MFLKIADELLNYQNLQYFEFEENTLSIYFNGNVGSKIKQNENEFLNFIELIKKNENIIILNDNKIGINLINVSGISNEDKMLSIYFIDGSKKIFKSLNFKDIEKQILGE